MPLPDALPLAALGMHVRAAGGAWALLWARSPAASLLLSLSAPLYPFPEHADQRTAPRQLRPVVGAHPCRLLLVAPLHPAISPSSPAITLSFSAIAAWSRMSSEATLVNYSLRMTRSDLGASWDAYKYYKSMAG